MEDNEIFNKEEKKEEKKRNQPSKANIILGIIFIAVGLLVLLAINNLIDFALLAKYFIPASLIIVGAILLTKSRKIKLTIVIVTIILVFGLMIGSKIHHNCRHCNKYTDKELFFDDLKNLDLQSDTPQSEGETAELDAPAIPE